MDRILKTIVASQIKGAIPLLLNLAFTGAGELSRIESDVISNSLKEYVRKWNKGQKRSHEYKDEEYISALSKSLPLKDMSVKEICDFVERIPKDFSSVVVSPEICAKYICHFWNSRSEIRSMLRDNWFEVKKEVEIASIEQPFLEQRLADTLGLKRIRYNLIRRPCGHVLEVQIIQDRWMKGPLTVENVDRVTGLVPYFINRPDRLAIDMPEYRIVRKG